MTNAEILSLAYQKQAAGDSRLLTEIITSVKADAAAMAPTIDPSATVGAMHLALPDGSIQQKEIKGDGSTVSVNS